MKSGNLNFLEPSGPLQVSNGIVFYRPQKPNLGLSMKQMMIIWTKAPIFLNGFTNFNPTRNTQAL